MLTLDALSYRYRRNTQPSLCDVSLQVQAGQCLGLLGPNGAGKTTLISLVAGLLPLQQGSVCFAGQALQRARQQQGIALVPQDLAFYPMLTVRENLDCFAGVQAIAQPLRRQRMAQAMAFCQLEQVAQQRAAELSGGLRRRLNLAIGLLGDPQLLLLDEPTVGVDPQSRHFLLDSIRHLRDSGKAIVYTSHYMDEIEALCDTVAILDHGRLLLQGTMQQVLTQAQDGLHLRLTQPLPEALAKAWQQSHTLQTTGASSYQLDVPAAALPAIVQQLATHGCEIESISYGQRTLEQVFMQRTRRALRDTA